jgi:hypothetical protein
MATIFESRPRAVVSAPAADRPAAPATDDQLARAALAALDAAVRALVEASTEHPSERRRAVDLLTFHARRLARMEAAQAEA